MVLFAPLLLVRLFAFHPSSRAVRYTDRTVDGRDLDALLRGDTDESPHEAFFYYRGPNLEAVRVGKWKLHVAKGSVLGDVETMLELYDLEADIGETTDLAAQHPEIVADLQARLDGARSDLGDGITDSHGADVRPKGEVDDPQPLTFYDPTHPYYMAEYDLGDRG